MLELMRRNIVIAPLPGQGNRDWPEDTWPTLLPP